ncbi:hypothetical protein B7C42_08113 [Nocardia cerradoensis]|jgi:hypothetical protein|uniref:Uncharacterized protein n=1 Tax=Nocardia cerradoensis TaxID=85688 RepID=A0A231GTE1_9NOCA|nr:hypothetical protein B7C42_08113 [Nocardia cerradoensis]
MAAYTAEHKLCRGQGCPICGYTGEVIRDDDYPSV